jgi:hypothetical protein
VTTPSSDDPKEEKISRLSAENRRYRELIQNLSSAVEILRHRHQSLHPPAPEILAFEKIDEEETAPDVCHTRGSRAARAMRRVFKRAKGDTSGDLRPLTPNPGWKCLAVDTPQIRIGFTLFGMTAGAIEEAVKEVETRQVRSRDFTPVFITDSPDLEPFRVRGYVVEYLPASVTSGRSRDERRYLRDRIDLITAKWCLGKVVHLGHARS